MEGAPSPGLREQGGEVSAVKTEKLRGGALPSGHWCLQWEGSMKRILQVLGNLPPGFSFHSRQALMLQGEDLTGAKLLNSQRPGTAPHHPTPEGDTSRAPSGAPYGQILKDPAGNSPPPSQACEGLELGHRGLTVTPISWDSSCPTSPFS